MKINKSIVLEWVYITVGVALAAATFSFLLDPINLVIGGISGLGTVLNNVLEIDTAMIILIINIVLLFLGLLLLGKDFFIKTVYGSIAFPLFIKLFDLVYQAIDMNPITDKTIITFFGSIMMGLGLGIVLKYGGTTGGTEIPQKILLKYFHIPYSVSLYIFDGIVILLGIIVFQDLSLALYGIVFIFLSGFAVDQVVFSGFNKRAINIISKHNQEILDRIIKEIGRGVTMVKIVGGYSKEESEKLICVLSSFEFYKLKGIIKEVDPDAFYYAVRATEVSGEGFSYVRRD